MKIFTAVIMVIMMLGSALAQEITEPKLDQRNNTVIIREDFGGFMTNYMMRYSEMQQKKLSLAIDGICASSCTLFMGYIPREQICITRKARLGFHRASRPEGTMVMMMNYPPIVTMWLLAEGITEDIKFLPEAIMLHMYSVCPDDLIAPPPQEQEKVD